MTNEEFEKKAEFKVEQQGPGDTSRALDCFFGLSGSFARLVGASLGDPHHE